MGKIKKGVPGTLVLGFIVLFSVWGQAKSRFWTTAYYRGEWTKSPDPQVIHPSDIDYSALTHLIYFGIAVHPDGSLDLSSHFVDSQEARDVISRAHKVGTKVLVSVGGNYRDAVSGQTLEVLLNNLMNVVSFVGYDGLDIDWEPLTPGDYSVYANLIEKLRQRLGPKRLLTAAVIDAPGLFNTLQGNFDQINLMTYDLSGLWVKVLWHNSALYGEGVGEQHYRRSEHFLNSVDSEVKKFTDAGVARGKLGVGLEFYGYAWKGGLDSQGSPVTAPKEEWLRAPTIDDGMPYFTIMKKYFSKNVYHWDQGAKVPYLSIPDPQGDHLFISFEDSRSCVEKAKYVKHNHLGGLMVWELAGDLKEASLLQAIKKALPRKH